VLGGPLLLRESGSTAVQLDTQMEPSTCYGVNHPVDRSKNNGLQQFRLVRRRKAAEPTWELEFRGCIFHPFYPRPLACEVEENHKVTYIYPSRRFSNCVAIERRRHMYAQPILMSTAPAGLGRPSSSGVISSATFCTLAISLGNSVRIPCEVYIHGRLSCNHG
jgi:hypothetical protein